MSQDPEPRGVDFCLLCGSDKSRARWVVFRIRSGRIDELDERPEGQVLLVAFEAEDETAFGCDGRAAVSRLEFPEDEFEEVREEEVV